MRLEVGTLRRRRRRKGRSKETRGRIVAVSEIVLVIFGQRTEKFLKANRKDLEHISFSIVYGR